jgi:hypothetical protein
MLHAQFSYLHLCLLHLACRKSLCCSRWLQATLYNRTEVTRRNGHTDVLHMLCCSVAQLRLPAGCWSCCMHRVCASCQDRRHFQPGLFDRLVHLEPRRSCTASRVGHAVRMLYSTICRLLCLLLVHRVCATCHCNERLASSLVDLTHISTKIHRCHLVYLA